MNLLMSSRKTLGGAQPFFGDRIEAILQDIREALESGELAQGPKLAAFENAMAACTGSRYALGVSSGGVALELALKAMGVLGGEVVVPTNTFVASASSVVQAGGRPVFCDIERDTLCLDPLSVEKVLSDRTKAIMVVHMFGLVSPAVVQIRELCRRRGLRLIEDAAHAHGAGWDGVPAGRLGDVGCFSFFATKVLTTGEGGAITTDDESIKREVLRLRNHGRSVEAPVYEIVSNNYRLAEIPAILGLHQLAILDALVRRRRAIAHQYRQQLSDIPGLTLLPDFPDCEHSYWRFPAYVDPTVDRDDLQRRMHTEHGVRITWMYEPLCHLQPVFGESHGHRRGDFPVGEECMRRLICLPTHGGISDADVARVCIGLRSILAAGDTRS